MMVQTALLSGLYSYYQTRRSSRLTRAQLEWVQRRKLQHWLKKHVPGVRACEDLRGLTPETLSTAPLMDKAKLMADFATYNQPCITEETAWQAFHGSKRYGRYTIGASTGTSGNRGLFVVSEQERFRWLGAILAKALPGFWCGKERVAIVLPLNTPLYNSANETSLISLRFFDLTRPLEELLPDLVGFDPTTLVAPPKVLGWLAGKDTPLNPKTVFSAAETLDDLEKGRIEQRFGAPLRQIYMATEGLLAVSCTHGNLHLSEDAMFFEWDSIDEVSGLKVPIISDFSRQTQIMLRYRLNDLLELCHQPCSCGSPLSVAKRVVGRQDDCFHLTSLRAGAEHIMITPDVIRNAVVDSCRDIKDFRVIQRSAGCVDLVLQDGVEKNVQDAAQTALFNLLAGYGAQAKITCKTERLDEVPARKLRRVENAALMTEPAGD